jgi:hypothetical protein
MNFPGKTHPVTEWFEVVRHALGLGTACRVIPGTPVSKGELTAEKLGSAWLAHRFGKIGAIEDQSLGGQSINIWSLRVLTTKDRQVAVGAVVRHDDQKIGAISSPTG